MLVMRTVHFFYNSRLMPCRVKHSFIVTRGGGRGDLSINIILKVCKIIVTTVNRGEVQEPSRQMTLLFGRSALEPQMDPILQTAISFAFTRGGGGPWLREPPRVLMPLSPTRTADVLRKFTCKTMMVRKKFDLFQPAIFIMRGDTHVSRSCRAATTDGDP